jgi:hypothetical protein
LVKQNRRMRILAEICTRRACHYNETTAGG